MMRTFTPRLCAATTVPSSVGSEKRNIFTRIESLAPLMASTIGLAESSGKTIRERDIRVPSITDLNNTFDSVLQFATTIDKQRQAKAGNGNQTTHLRHNFIQPSVELRTMQLGIDPIPRHQLFMRTTLRDDSPGNHNYLI